MLFSDDDEITHNVLILWALRICGANNSCFETLQIIHDWFGKDTKEFIENVQLIYWANCTAGNIDCRLLPCTCSSMRAPERLLLDAVAAQINGHSNDVEKACNKLAGPMAGFAKAAIERISNLIFQTSENAQALRIA